MATLNKLVYDIREALNKFSDDDEISNRYITYLINVKRARFLKQELDRFGRKFNNTILQTYCSPLEEVSANECGLELPCEKISRTTLKVPDLLQLTSRDALARVAGANKLSKPITVIARNRAPYASSSIFNTTKAFLHDDDRLYVFNNDGPVLFNCISITGVFEDPTELATYQDCCDCSETATTCFDPMVNDYPLTPHLIDVVRKDIINELAQLQGTREDKENDSDDQ